MSFTINVGGSDAASWYSVLKDFQTLVAAVLALCAAAVAFLGVRYSARMSYNAAQDAANAKIKFDREQAEIAHNKKQAAIVSWIYSRTIDARRLMENNTIRVIKFDQGYRALKNDDKFLGELIQNYAASVNSQPDIYDQSDLSKVTLEFITEMDEVDQSNFFAITRSMGTFDEWMHGIQSGLDKWSALVEESKEIDREEIEIMLRGERKSIEDEARYIKALEASIAKRYQEIRNRIYPERAAAAAPESKPAAPPTPANDAA
jgi:hypothetical protein